MKNAVLLFLLSCLFFGCKKDSEARLKIEEAEELIMSEKPDSAFVLLKSITNPDVLNDKTFARWCLAYAGACEQLDEDMPFVSQLFKANGFYEEHGTNSERIRSWMYLGQAFEEEKSFDKAMQVYLQAVDLAKNKQEYLLLGKIYNKIAWLHDFSDNYDEAQRFHLLSGESYLKINDNLNYIYSIRDIGWIYTLKEEYGEASESFLKAYKLALNLNDSLLLSSLTNRMGINYVEMGNYSLAEKYLLQSIAYDEAGSTPTYLALADLYTSKKEYEKARHYIKIATLGKTSNRNFKGGLLYQLYLLEKGLGNYSLSLNYYEQYSEVEDSISALQEKVNLLKVEKRYEYANLLNENHKLEIKNQWVIIVCCCLIIICFLLLGMYKYHVALKNKHIYQQQKRIQNEQSVLLEKELALEGLSTTVLKIRENILTNSDIYKKIIENSQSIEKSIKYPLTNKDWLSLKEVVKSTYILFFENLQNHFSNLTEAEVRFCCLLKLELNSQQLSILLNIQPQSLSHKRYLIMKKGELENTNTTLETVIANL